MKREKKEEWLKQTQRMVTTVEIIMILIVLIALVILFKDVIIGFVEGLLEGIEEQSGVFNPGSLVG